MGRFKAGQYDPRKDSTPGAEQPGVLVIHSAPGLCKCGCLSVTNGKSQFQMGHDARLKGKLLRAHLADAPVLFGNLGIEQVDPRPAVEIAELFDGKHSWSATLREATERRDGERTGKITQANRTVAARAIGPQKGDRTLIRIGRWEYTGQVAAVYSVKGGKEVETEYVDKDGAIKRARQKVAQ